MEAARLLLVVRPDLGSSDVPLGEASDLFALIDAAHLIEKALDRRLSTLDLNLAQMRTLLHLSFARETLSPTELAEGLFLEVQTVSKMVEGLERRGLVQRRRHPLDRRSVLIDLTVNGEAKALRSLEVLKDVAQEFDGSGLTALDRATLLDGLAQTAHQAGMHVRRGTNLPLN
jgi:DNA-binding MarR family transcriptional regulator